MIIAFVIWSLCALLFLGIGISSRRSKQAVGFFTFVKPPEVRDLTAYNRAVSRLWLVMAAVFEMIGIPILFVKQNSAYYLFAIVIVMFAIIGMAVVYLKIEAKYRK